MDTTPEQKWQIGVNKTEKLYWWTDMSRNVELFDAVEVAGGDEGWEFYTLQEDHLAIEHGRLDPDWTITEI